MSYIYTYLIADLLTGTVRAEIPVTTMKFNVTLNTAGGWSATAPITTATANSPFNKMTAENLDVGRTSIWVLRDGVPLYGGILWAVSADIEAGTISMGGKDLWSYYDHRLLNKTQTFAAVDQYTMVKTIIDYTNTLTAGDIGLVIPSATSGVTRDRTYYAHEYRVVSDIIEALSSLQDGFDFRWLYTGSVQAGFIATMEFAARMGRSTDLTFELGKNVEITNYQVDGVSMSNRVTAIGAGEGTAMVNSVAADAGSLARYPLLESAFVRKTVSTQSVLDAHAAAQLQNVQAPIQTITVKIIDNGPDVKLGSFIIGDDVRVVASSGFVNIDDRFRILSYTVEINESGEETTELSLTQLESTV